MKDKIFIQIASYRDPELIPTIKDCIDKAKYPNNLRFGIAWQHSEDDEWDILDEFQSDDRFIIIDIDYKESEGVCWARNAIQHLYNDEKYTLQLDSHHRFVKNWDEELISMMETLQSKGIKKPLLTGYIPSFNPKNDPEERVQEPWMMNFDRFTPEGVVFFLPATIPNWENLNEPVPARFYSAHFTFTLGQFCEEVKHDPNMYFHGEEISIAVRAFTHGYDLFHPHKVIAWHEYTRKGRTKHWDDSKNWVEKNNNTYARLKALLGTDGTVCTNCMKKKLHPYGLGEERTLLDYEKYVGIRFKDRGVQEYTTLHKLPPNPHVEDYENSFHTIFRHCIDIHLDSVPEDDYEFWAVVFEDKNGNEIYRKDASSSEIVSLKKSSESNNKWINLWREYNGPLPYQWVVWPYSKSKEWCNKLTGKLVTDE